MRLVTILPVFLLVITGSCKTTNQESATLDSEDDVAPRLAIVGCYQVQSASRSNQTEVGSATKVCLESTPGNRSGEYSWTFTLPRNATQSYGANLTQTFRCPGCYTFTGVIGEFGTRLAMDSGHLALNVVDQRSGETAEFQLAKIEASEEGQGDESDEHQSLAIAGCYQVYSASRSNGTEVGSATKVCLESTPGNRSGEYSWTFTLPRNGRQIYGANLTQTFRCPGCYRFTGVIGEFGTRLSLDTGHLSLNVLDQRSDETAEFELVKIDQ